MSEENAPHTVENDQVDDIVNMFYFDSGDEDLEAMSV
jgi:hypothetical protein